MVETRKPDFHRKITYYNTLIINIDVKFFYIKFTRLKN